MSAVQPWVGVGLSALNVVVVVVAVVVVAFYVDGPRRKRLLDDIGLRDATRNDEASNLLGLSGCMTTPKYDPGRGSVAPLCRVIV